MNDCEKIIKTIIGWIVGIGIAIAVVSLVIGFIKGCM